MKKSRDSILKQGGLKPLQFAQTDTLDNRKQICEQFLRNNQQFDNHETYQLNKFRSYQKRESLNSLIHNSKRIF